MAYSELVAKRIVEKLNASGAVFTEKKMFGGIAYMINDKMCVGVTKEQMMLRVMDEHFDALVEENYVHAMSMRGKTMRGFLFIDQEAFSNDADLNRLVSMGLEFGEKGELKSKKKK